MSATLARLTARQILGRRRTLVMAGVLLIPVAIAAALRFWGEPDPGQTTEEVAFVLVAALILTLLLPIITVVLATGALGSEIEDGTVVFVLTTPVPRWQIVIVKTAVAAVASAVLVVPSTVSTVWMLHESPTADGLAVGMGLASAVAAVLYSVVFVAVSARTSRSLIVGLVYVFVWETFATSIFGGLRWLSIRDHAIGWSDMVVTLSHGDVYDPRLDVGSAVVASIVVVVASLVLGSRWLSRYEVGERS